MSIDKSRTQFESAIEFISDFNDIFYQTIGNHLGYFIEDGFLKKLFDKNPSMPVDKAQLLIEKFGESANSTNFTSQAQATNIQLTTLSLIFSIALFVSSRSWDNFVAQFFHKFGDMGDDEDEDDMFDESSKDEHADRIEFNQKVKEFKLQTPKTVDKTPLLPDMELSPVIFLAKNPDDKQVKHQSTTANPDVQTSAKNSQKDKKSSESTQILTGYEAVGDEQEQI
ncbi:hypothetical protein RhiirA4_452229 [Rhizophagus irregularis]|uniref:Uncharacterized protein n=1 Tax=Rhizophagus irregularis TaxID=588596 RepID=A0A2I1FXM9_9GLOM|nr:hypothetical protein RhiirA4_452229 [Rhizophagus irregularis]